MRYIVSLKRPSFFYVKKCSTTKWTMPLDLCGQIYLLGGLYCLRLPFIRFSTIYLGLRMITPRSSNTGAINTSTLNLTAKYPYYQNKK